MTVEVPEAPPWDSERELGLAETVKSQTGPLTVIGMVIECESEGLLDVPVTLTPYDPGGAELQLTLTVRGTEAVPPGAKLTLIESVELVHVWPWKQAMRLLLEGDCAAERVTVPVNPLILFRVIDNVPDPP